MSNQPRAPSSREIINKVQEALDALNDNSIEIVDPRHNAEALELCEAQSMDELFDYIADFLKEIQDIGAEKCFAKRTVEKSYHQGFADLELFSYAWESTLLNKRLYLKFGIRKPSEKRPLAVLTYCHLDCHESR